MPDTQLLDDATPRSLQSPGLTGSTALSLGLVVTLLVGAIVAGRQMQRIDAMDETLREARAEISQMRVEMADFRVLLIQRTQPQSSPPSR